MEKQKKNPELRFKGFSEGWIEHTLEEKVEFFSGLTYSPNNIVKDKGTLVLRSSNVKNGEIVSADNVYVDSSVVNSSNVEEGDIAVVVRNGSRSLIGKHAQIKRQMNNTVIGAFMTGIRAEYSDFINALLDTPQFDKEVEANLGATINQITTGAFKKMKFWFPKPQEQQQIGSFFKKIDELITKHQKKHNRLVILKKSMLEKMFPKEGQSVPEIRFKGFEGDWESELIGNKMDVTSVKRIHQSDWTNTGIPFLRARDIVAISKNEEQTDKLFISHQKYDEYSKISGKVSKGDLLVTGVGTIGVPLLITKDEPLYFKDGNVIWLRNNNQFDSNFFYYSFTTRNIQNYIKEAAGIGTVGTYTIDSGKKTPISFPSFEEQEKLGQYFRNIDNLISNHKNQLQKLKNFKQSLSEKMFV